MVEEMRKGFYCLLCESLYGDRIFRKGNLHWMREKSFSFLVAEIYKSVSINMLKRKKTLSASILGRKLFSSRIVSLKFGEFFFCNFCECFTWHIVFNSNKSTVLYLLIDLALKMFIFAAREFRVQLWQFSLHEMCFVSIQNFLLTIRLEICLSESYSIVNHITLSLLCLPCGTGIFLKIFKNLKNVKKSSLPQRLLH